MKLSKKTLITAAAAAYLLVNALMPSVALADPIYLIDPNDVSGSVEKIQQGSQTADSGAGTGDAAGKVIGGINITANQAKLTTTGTQDLPTIIGRAINYLFGVISVVFLTIILVGGYLWLTAGGNEEKIAKAKAFVINGVLGMLVIFTSYALAYGFMYALATTIGITP
jgi:hypothetical protein